MYNSLIPGTIHISNFTISNRSKSGGRKRKKKHRKNKGHHSKKQSFNNRYGKMTGYNFLEFQ